MKYKELIAVGVALTTQCPYCIGIHTDGARKAGASEAELTEAAMVAASLVLEQLHPRHARAD